MRDRCGFFFPMKKKPSSCHFDTVDVVVTAVTTFWRSRTKKGFFSV